jgi:hypothetical protein
MLIFFNWKWFFGFALRLLDNFYFFLRLTEFITIFFRWSWHFLVKAGNSMNLLLRLNCIGILRRVSKCKIDILTFAVTLRNHWGLRIFYNAWVFHDVWLRGEKVPNSFFIRSGASVDCYIRFGKWEINLFQHFILLKNTITVLLALYNYQASFLSILKTTNSLISAMNLSMRLKYRSKSSLSWMLDYRISICNSFWKTLVQTVVWLPKLNYISHFRVYWMRMPKKVTIEVWITCQSCRLF